MVFDKTITSPPEYSTREIAKRNSKGKRPSVWCPEQEDDEEDPAARQHWCPVTMASHETPLLPKVIIFCLGQISYGDCALPQRVMSTPSPKMMGSSSRLLHCLPPRQLKRQPMMRRTAKESSTRRHRRIRAQRYL